MQLKSLIVGLSLAFMTPACAVSVDVNDHQLLGPSETDEDRIRAVMQSQQEAWNSGDIDGFMDGYWRSEELRFASGGTVTQGWQSTRDRYHTNYSDRSVMGTLAFDGLDVEFLASDAAVVHGAWALQREKDQPSGLFTLVFRKIEGHWKIISDTTTSAD